MELLSMIGGALWTAISYGVPFLFVLTVVVFIHELGHFQVARWCGVAIETFSIGFGRELFGWNDRHGTRWRIAAIPLGGYVKFEGDENAASKPAAGALDGLSADQRARNFHGQPVWKRAAIVVAGPLANFILAIAIFSVVFGLEGRQVTLPYVAAVIEGGVAEKAGIKAGDRIDAINGVAMESFNDLIRAVSGAAGDRLDIRIERDGRLIDIAAVPEQVAQQTSLGIQRRAMLGVRKSDLPEHQRHETFSPLGAVRAGIAQNNLIIEQTLAFFGRLFTGREHVDQISGIGRIAQASGETAKAGFVALIMWLGYISTSIGLLNLMPIPVLDGGHLVFYTLEAIRGRPLSERVQEYTFRFGLAIVLMLMIVANWNDVVHFASRAAG